MKKKIHPVWYDSAVVTCSCGNTFTTGSTKPSLQVDICSACHPFFTGEMKFVDRQGRVDKFLAKQKAAQAKQAANKKKRKTSTDKKQADSKSYKELLRQQQQVMKQSKTQAAA